MSNNKQTAVEWLVNRIKHLIPDDIGSQLFLKSQHNKAKEMEEQQKKDAYLRGIKIMTQPLNQNKMKPQNQFIETLITILGVLAIAWLVLTLITI